jgi:heme-degrading monooxygenase HmoA
MSASISRIPSPAKAWAIARPMPDPAPVTTATLPFNSCIGSPNPSVRAAYRGNNGRMILEHALLDVLPGKEAEFESAFAEARHIVGAAAGFRRLRLERCIERPNRYLLLIEWDTLEDHTEGFRGSPGYQRWRELLHHFYDPFPTVDHYRTVLSSDSAPT